VRLRSSRLWALAICTLGFLLSALPGARAQESAYLGVIVASDLDQPDALPPWQDYADALVAELSASKGLSAALLYEGSPLVRSRHVQFPSIGDPRHWRTLEPLLAELAGQLQLGYVLVTCLRPPAAGDQNAVAAVHGLIAVRGDGAHRIQRLCKLRIAPGGIQVRQGNKDRRILRLGLAGVQAAFERGDYDAAAIALRKAFEEQEPSGELYLWRARISLAQHREDDAARDLGSAVAASPDLLEARLRLAHLLTKGGLWQDAVKQYEAALALAPDNTEGLLGLARVYRDNGHRRKAIELLETARQTKPQDATVLVALADLYAAGSDAQLAEPLYLQAVGLSSTEASASILERLGDLYVKLRRHRDALKCYVQAAELNPSRNAMVKRRYRDVMQAADDTVREELRKTWRTLEDYVRDGVGEREQVYARLSAYNQHLEEALRFADSVVPPSSLETERPESW